MNLMRNEARKLYEGIPGSHFQKWRPAICPFEALVTLVPRESEVLDVGCGSGLFLGLLAQCGRIRRGTGFDSNADAIARAECMRARLQQPDSIVFEYRDAQEVWPTGPFDVVSVIDVMHHVPPAAQRSIIERAASRLKPGGLLIYKDMVEHPKWRAWMNRLHDLVLVREWINYAPLQSVCDWAQAAGLQEIHRAHFNLLWYGHELVVFRR